MKIDWSKAPEGAKGFAEIGLSRTPVWFGDDWYEYHDGPRYRFARDSDDIGHFAREAMSNIRRRPELIEPDFWNGTGLPAVGAKCEVEVYEGEWFACTVVAHFEGRAVIVLGNRESSYICNAEQLRPIRTHENIAAEKREREIADIERVIKAAHYGLVRTDISPAEKAKHYAATLHNAGYRKTEQEHGQ